MYLSFDSTQITSTFSLLPLYRMKNMLLNKLLPTKKTQHDCFAASVDHRIPSFRPAC